ncbi:MAG: Tad domain-containing protein, partial [Chloroflexota bacterium]
MKSSSVHTKKQNGQAIVLVAITMVVLLAFTGLAIDGGGMFLLYRDAQNATDAATLTAAYALCTDGDPVTAGLRSAEQNGFDNSQVVVNHPPVENPAYVGDISKVEVLIEAQKPSYFIQIVFDGPLIVRTEAIGHCNSATLTDSSDIVNRYAFRSLAGQNDCTGSPAWDLAGTGWTMEGDVWMPNIGGNDNIGQVGGGNAQNFTPSTDDNRIDVIGNITIGQASTYSLHTNHPLVIFNYDPNTGEPTGGTAFLAEDLPTSTAATNLAGHTGYGGDGTIEYGEPAPDGLPFNMDYFRPVGSPLCSTPQCGALQQIHGSSYHDISHGCNVDGAGISQQDFIQNAATFGNYYDSTTNTWDSGIYYASCDIAFNDNDMRGEVSFIAEGSMDFSNKPYNMVNFGGAPLFVSNEETGSSSNCTTPGSYAIQLNADSSYFRGPMIAFRGGISIQGNDFVLESCISARGFSQNGNENA